MHKECKLPFSNLIKNKSSMLCVHEYVIQFPEILNAAMSKFHDLHCNYFLFNYATYYFMFNTL